MSIKCFLDFLQSSIDLSCPCVLARVSSCTQGYPHVAHPGLGHEATLAGPPITAHLASTTIPDLSRVCSAGLPHQRLGSLPRQSHLHTPVAVASPGRPTLAFWNSNNTLITTLKDHTFVFLEVNKSLLVLEFTTYCTVLIVPLVLLAPWTLNVCNVITLKTSD